MTRLKKSLIILTISITGLGFWAFTDTNFAIAKNLDIFYTLFREMNMLYVDETDPERMIKTAIDGMLKQLDPYTVYIPESEIEDFKFMTTGNYGGIGAMIRKSGEYVVVSEPYKNFPAAKYGLRAGDVLIKIDQIDTKGKSTEVISEMLKGEPGSSLTVEILRPGESTPRTIQLKREKIQIKSVPYYGMLNDSVGYFVLSSFTQNAHTEVKEAVNALVEKGAKSLVFDLRSNPGGLLIESVQIVNLFVEKGHEVVSTKGRVKQWDKTYKTENNALFPDIPLTVLVNSGSASASEIVSGALQDLDRAVIIGTRTFGKGLVQTTRPLSYNAQLKVTTAKYYIPSGRCIQALDYSHRNEDGSVGKIPDSLMTEFKTKNNRSVFDGGGILPDLNSESETLSNIAFSLIVENYIFDYATEYRNQHDSIPVPKKFAFSDAEYQAFCKWVSTKDLKYESESAQLLDELIKTAKEENYYQSATSTFEQLKASLAKDSQKDLITFKSQIVRLIEQEIVTRYYYEEGSIENMLPKDPAIQAALDILGQKTAYQSVLVGVYPKGQIKIKK